MRLRQNNIDKLREDVHDVLVIGGGINGAVSSAALAGRGLRTALIDAGDFAGCTSMNSSNLAWGGIKYLESHDYALVRKLCKSRNRLMRNYPSSVREIRFLTTITKGFRYHPLYLWAGTWLYWLMGNGFTRIPRLHSKRHIKQAERIINTDNSIGGFEYSDAYLRDNDARFVFHFVQAAMNSGCATANYVESLGGTYEDGIWTIHARNRIDGSEFDIRARALINAAGPFADDHNNLTGIRTEHSHALSKGVHLIVDRLTADDRVLAFFADDGRLFFVIPMGSRTCIGTTDQRVDSPAVEVDDDDIDFILDNINKRLTLDRVLTRDDIISTRCGVRPLAVESDGANGRDFLQLSRKHAIDIDASRRHVSIFGGKLTDCINVGDEICEHVENMGISLPQPDYKWYGEPPTQTRDEFLRAAEAMGLERHAQTATGESQGWRLWRRYGAQAFDMLESIRNEPREADILIPSTDYMRCEIRHAAESEMVTTLEDFLRRRSEIALIVRRSELKAADGLMEACQLLFGPDARVRFDAYFEPSASETEGEIMADEKAIYPGH